MNYPFSDPKKLFLFIHILLTLIIPSKVNGQNIKDQLWIGTNLSPFFQNSAEVHFEINPQPWYSFGLTTGYAYKMDLPELYPNKALIIPDYILSHSSGPYLMLAARRHTRFYSFTRSYFYFGIKAYGSYYDKYGKLGSYRDFQSGEYIPEKEVSLSGFASGLIGELGAGIVFSKRFALDLGLHIAPLIYKSKKGISAAETPGLGYMDGFQIILRPKIKFTKNEPELRPYYN